MKRFAFTAAFLALLVAPVLAQNSSGHSALKNNSAQYNFTQVDFPGAAQTNLIAINDYRQYVGASIDADGTNHAIYFNGTTLSLLDPGGVVGLNFSFALSLNLRGDIVGGYFDASGVAHGFLYNAAGYNGNHVINIDYPGASGTFAYGVNDRREVIGVYADSAGNQHAFLLRDGVFTNTDLAGGVLTVPFSINDLGEVVGQFETVTGTTGHGYFELPDGKFTTFDAPAAPPNSTFLISINNNNVTLGTWVDANLLNHNFVLAQGAVQNFNVPKSFNATQASVQTLNDLTDVVGWFADAQNVQHGFLALRK